MKEKDQEQAQSTDMYSQLANRLDENRQNRVEMATQAMQSVMQDADLSEVNEQIRLSEETAKHNAENPNLPRALRNPKSKGITLLQCFGIMLVILGIQVAIGLPIGSVIAKNAQYEALTMASSAEEYVDIYMDLYMRRYSEATGTMTFIVTVASLLVGLIWYLRGYVGKNAIEKLKMSVRRTCTPKMFGIIVLLGIGLQFGMAVVAAIEDLVVPATIIEDYEETFGMAGLSSWAGILAVVVAAPINEELFFRGIIFRKMKNAWSVLAAVVTAALLFSLMHMIPYQVIYTIPAGFALALVMKKYDSIVPCILIHMCVNGLSFGVQLVSEALSKNLNDAMITLIYVVVAGGCIAGATKLMKSDSRIGE